LWVRPGTHPRVDDLSGRLLPYSQTVYLAGKAYQGNFFQPRYKKVFFDEEIEVYDKYFLTSLNITIMF
jgi:hypothetical protein